MSNIYIEHTVRFAGLLLATIVLAVIVGLSLSFVFPEGAEEIDPCRAEFEASYQAAEAGQFQLAYDLAWNAVAVTCVSEVAK